MDLQSIASQLQTNLEAEGGLDGSVKVVIGGASTVMIAGDTVSLTDGDADCDIEMDEETLSEITSGSLDSVTAFMTGRMKIDGNMGLAMKLAPILSQN